ncbi:antitoxin VapB family protein [Halobaculum magnesiiphilum]|uniref:Antitoxin VapB family protein n=1 Tax=Halobaculum magnesiiphilum TaxID=1017351 RepID=A0A8T8WI30_9EURY|nr:antitoxin VapB family protein [Halobaculum magnesiiphilum]QZP39497.1 antitoxin VapB family protein [Halobaculum magnesiiphilum]
MSTKPVRLDEDVYNRIKAHKRDDETFSEAIDRLIGGPSLRDLGGILDSDTVDTMREEIEAVEDDDAEEVEAVAERFE